MQLQAGKNVHAYLWNMKFYKSKKSKYSLWFVHYIGMHNVVTPYKIYKNYNFKTKNKSFQTTLKTKQKFLISIAKK